MLTPRETEILRETLAPYADAIDRVVLFGSRALGTSRPSSDIDLAIFSTLDQRQMARLWTLFDESSLAVTVDLIDYARLTDPAMKRHIDRVGKTVFTRDELTAANRARPASRGAS